MNGKRPFETALTPHLDFQVPTESKVGRVDLFAGDEALTERVDLIGADAFIESCCDGQVQAGEQLHHTLFLAAAQHRHSLTAIMSHRYTTDRAYIADSDLAMFQELRDGRQALV
jgi:hypothetical protein